MKGSSYFLRGRPLVCSMLGMGIVRRMKLRVIPDGTGLHSMGKDDCRKIELVTGKWPAFGLTDRNFIQGILLWGSQYGVM